MNMEINKKEVYERRLKLASWIIMGILVIEAIIRCYRVNHISTSFYMGLILIYIIYLMQKKQSQGIALSFAVMAIYSMYLTVKKDASEPLYLTLDWIGNGVVLISSLVAFQCARQLKKQKGIKIIWKNAVLLYVLGFFYAILGTIASINH